MSSLEAFEIWLKSQIHEREGYIPYFKENKLLVNSENAGQANVNKMEELKRVLTEVQNRRSCENKDKNSEIDEYKEKIEKLEHRVAELEETQETDEKDYMKYADESEEKKKLLEEKLETLTNRFNDLENQIQALSSIYQQSKLHGGHPETAFLEPLTYLSKKYYNAFVVKKGYGRESFRVVTKEWLEKSPTKYSADMLMELHYS